VEKDLQKFGGKTFWKRFLQNFGEKFFLEKNCAEIW
jgi:hypothetical protein